MEMKWVAGRDEVADKAHVGFEEVSLLTWLYKHPSLLDAGT